MTQSEHPQVVDKVGAAILRKKGDHYEALIVQVKAKNEGELPSMGLVRGTRRFLKDGVYTDANRNGNVPPHDAVWEADYDNIATEMREEAGVTSEMLKRHPLYDMGVAQFTSNRKPGGYPIKWFATVLDEEAQAALPHTGPRKAPGFLEDAVKTEWMSLDKIRALAQVKDVTKERVSEGYIAIIEAAIAGIEAQKFSVLQEQTATIQPLHEKTSFIDLVKQKKTHPLIKQFPPQEGGMAV